MRSKYLDEYMKLFPEKLNTFLKLAQQGSVGSIDDGDPGAKTSHKGKISDGGPAGAAGL